MDVTPATTTHEVIEVGSDSEDESDDDEDGEEAEEVEAVAEPEDDEEDDEDSEDSEEEDDEEGSDNETDVPTATQAPAPPTPPPKISISDLTTNDAASAVPVTAESSTPVPAADASEPTPAAAEAPGPASKKAKPVSVKRKRTPSPSPPPAPPPPPFTTIRLQITLGGPSNYEVDIIQMAKDTGQRAASPPPLNVVHVVETEEEPEEPTTGKKNKRKKKNAAQEYYDVNDPFIDDSELALDQRTHVAQTKQQGFYVSSGEIALLKDISPKKPKSKKPGLSAHLHSTVSQAVSAAAALKREASGAVERNGSPSEENAKRALGMNNGLKGVGITNGQNQPSADLNGKKPVDGPSTGGWTSNMAEDEADEKTGQKRKRYITVVEGGKKRKIVNINSFHPELQAAIEDLKKEIAKENWEQKGKFPPALKPHLSTLALLAIKLDEYDDHFFNLMPTLFPYNKFTMTKLIKRTVYPEHVSLLQERQDELLKELEELAKTGFTKAEEEWQRSVTLWDKRQEKARLDAENVGSVSAVVGGLNGANGHGSASAAPTRDPTEENDGMDVDTPLPSASAPPGTQGANAAAHPPAKKFRLTEQMKAIIWDLVLLSNECCRLENEKNQYEGSVIQVSEQGLRKVLYQKIVAAFPDGWMSSGQISRDVSAMKKRLEKEALENE
ncbi:hypothetical protein BKA70DRAFT_1098496 [Coprinopsis sp. MPI-PUGE-AT-0042]|nr:hypothetical protein BKA70DRAFT_1098496 [Coprinopsis sp. MPI-PUGE-AT-0042]